VSTGTKLVDRCVLVTGGGTGIGFALAVAAVAEGANVVIADVDPVAAAEATEALEGRGGTAVAAVTDVRSAEQLEEMARLAVERFGGIDVVVNNAGRHLGEYNVPCTQLDPARWDDLLAVNLTAPLACVRACLPAMRARGGGSVVNISSAAAYRPTRAYGVSKLGLIALTIALADELAADNIRVNALAPGLVDTPAAMAQWPPQRQEQILAQQRLKRPGLTADLAPAFLYLCSDDSSFVTGQTLSVDGGMTTRI
jgi:NAD(P)-dependent dehydrogenase (short-subunit alcohol dehydrogenase family)